MKVNCEVSCDSCTSEVTKAATAADPAVNCATWAAAGECTNNPVYMNENCAAACGVTAVTDAPAAKLTDAPAVTEAPAAATEAKMTEDTGKAGKDGKSKKSGKSSTDGKSTSSKAGKEGKSGGKEGKKGDPAAFKKGPQGVITSSAGAGMGVAAAGLVGLAVVGALSRKSSSGYAVVEPITEGTQFV